MYNCICKYILCRVESTMNVTEPRPGAQSNNPRVHHVWGVAPPSSAHSLLLLIPFMLLLSRWEKTVSSGRLDIQNEDIRPSGCQNISDMCGLSASAFLLLIRHCRCRAECVFSPLLSQLCLLCILPLLCLSFTITVSSVPHCPDWNFLTLSLYTSPCLCVIGEMKWIGLGFSKKPSLPVGEGS